ncbi:transcription termination factor NusA [Gemmatirosa kalamazoonensis]|uniref:Transcription termination/antitermination protein NusA n=1 Tax=Gemmatirosa kalamazoonensis TaxID=861299 RepID=W0RMS9_9BACT|nr:transcription termination factor NusA [Gemmatirosa kalamazoonensis]AHG90723.1 transcription termination factor NusA [Gemmatirosa kalamazoonensis]
MVASPDILNALRELTNAKQLDRAELQGLLQDGILAALAKKYGPTVNAEVDIDDETGQIRITLLYTVVAEVTDAAREISLDEARFEDEEFQVGDILERPVEFAEFGRAAVQAAKQRIIQRVREGERTRIKDEFSTKVGELLSGEVQQIERGKLVVMLNRFREAEAIIPYREQNHREHYHQGEPIRAVLKRVEDTPKGPRLILSRSDALFVQALFRLEVPEIQQNIVEIRAAAREVGSRTKIAVFSRDDSVDPVGACVGLKGARVQAVVNELGGERIDIVPWSADPERFAKLALAPAKVARVFSDAGSRTIQAIVDDDQLSLAIGRNGQNVRLASELTGWKIDLYSSREWLEKGGEERLFGAPEVEEEVPDVRLGDIAGIDPAIVAVLEDAGYRTLNDIIDLERDDFLRLPGIAPQEADRLIGIIDELTTEEEDESGQASADESASAGD